jgi:hypothetical protein
MTLSKALAAIEIGAAGNYQARRGQVTNGLYIEDSASRETKERSYAAFLEEHPEAYAAYREHHNAKGFIAMLEKAGVRLR